MVIINGRNKRKQDDYYPTPYTLAYQMLRAMKIPAMYTSNPDFRDGQGLKFLDPGCGDGIFGSAIRTAFPNAEIWGVDIVDRMSKRRASYDRFILGDFMNPDSVLKVIPPRYFDYVIGNPPYALAEEFIRKSVNLLNSNRPDAKVCFLLKLAFLESKKRARGLFSELPPSQVQVLAGRPSFTGDGKSNDYAFALFFWGHPKDSSIPPLVSWLDWS